MQEIKTVEVLQLRPFLFNVLSNELLIYPVNNVKGNKHNPDAAEPNLLELGVIPLLNYQGIAQCDAYDVDDGYKEPNQRATHFSKPCQFGLFINEAVLDYHGNPPMICDKLLFILLINMTDQ